MKFGTRMEQKMLHQMKPRSSQSDIALKIKAGIKLRLAYDLEFDLESNV